MSRASARCCRLALLSTFAVASASAAADSAGSVVTFPEYLDRLDRLSVAVTTDAAGVASLPALIEEWSHPFRVSGNGQTFEVPVSTIEIDLGVWENRHDATARERLLQNIRARRRDAEEFLRPPVDVASEQAALHDVLQSHEFRALQGPGWSDRLLQRLLQWLQTVLSFAIPASLIPTLGSALVYGIVTLAFMALAFATYRYIQRSSAKEIAHIRPSAPAPKDWSRWLSDARAAADRAEWRDATHFTYWCAVAFLEANGAWRPDCARTPREYLAVLPPASGAREQLLALTQDFERVWYGHAAADARSFDESFARLRQLGCPTA